MTHRQCALCAVFAIIVSIPLSAQQPPGVSYASLLNNVNYLPDQAKFSLGNQMQAVFVEAGKSGWVILRKGETDLYRWEFVTQTIEHPYTLIAFNKQTDIKTGESVYGFTELKEPGEYTLDFYLEGAKFYTFPFKLRVVPSSDPFSLPELRYLDGDWNDWGYLYYYKANPDQSLYWKVWMHHETAESSRKDVKVDIKIVRQKDKKTVCVSRGEVTYSIPRTWQRIEFDFIWPAEYKARFGEYFKTRDLLSTDGAYSLTMMVDGKMHGTWDFTVSNGKLAYTGRTERGKADPLTFIEGGRDAFWYKRK